MFLDLSFGDIAICAVLCSRYTEYSSDARVWRFPQPHPALPGQRPALLLLPPAEHVNYWSLLWRFIATLLSQGSPITFLHISFPRVKWNSIYVQGALGAQSWANFYFKYILPQNKQPWTVCLTLKKKGRSKEFNVTLSTLLAYSQYAQYTQYSFLRRNREREKDSREG